MLKLEPIERMSLALSAGSVGVAYAFASPRFATGMAVGAALEAVNLRAQVRGARAFFAGNWTRGAQGWMAGFGLRFGLLAIAIVLVLGQGVDPLGLVVGFSLSMPAVILWAWRNRPELIDHPVEPALAVDDPSWDDWNVWRGREVAPDDFGVGSREDAGDRTEETS